MILLGSMEIQWEESRNGTQSRVFYYYFVCSIIKGYTEWDHIQVGVIVQKMQHILK